MPTDPRVDAYIGKSAEFARPILSHLRNIVHAACPEVEETLKWGFPHFMYRGMLCGMASFKQHCAFGFWKAKLLEPIMQADLSNDAMGQFGKITSLKDLPSARLLTKYVRAAAKLNGDGIRATAKPSAKPKPPAKTPSDLAAALAKNKKARATFDAFSTSNKREYIEWITDAKTDATRARRLATAIEWMAEGKIRNWKYVK